MHSISVIVIVVSICYISINGQDIRNIRLIYFCSANSNLCYNGGTCSIVLGSAFKCACPPNFKGMFCEAVNDMNRCAFEICENGGSCVPDSSEGVKCICTAEWTDPLCNYPTGNF
ncbi:unnamed protein product [Adineta steineri]|uniref:EGF-like domain-containing protein n=1 Tax=Adineta steineri TaxID=433720 RepID=A0A819PW37_9BILA|nr:unnamed protein product [Adineta steineri]CAF4014492.1 unnamed protein product [Adineta steineri]